MRGEVATISRAIRSKLRLALKARQSCNFTLHVPLKLDKFETYSQ